MIATCPSCGKTYKVDDGKAGKVAKCSCGNRFTLGQEEEIGLAEVPLAAEDATGPADSPARPHVPPDPVLMRARSRSEVCAYQEKGRAAQIVARCVVAAAVILAGLGIWKFILAPNFGGAPASLPGPKLELTLDEFAARISSHSRSAVRVFPCAEFTRLIGGEPNRVMLLGQDAHLYYACQNGTMHVIVSAPVYANRTMLITKMDRE